MDRGMMGNYHVPCGAGEKLEITSNAYLLPTKSLMEQRGLFEPRCSDWFIRNTSDKIPS